MSYDDFDSLIPASPVVKPGSVIVYDTGDISKGLYYYVVTAVGAMESLSSHLIQVYARHRKNSISLSWDPVPGINEYRIYRGTSPDQFDGYFTVDSGYFVDTGYGLLNESQLNPPAR
jgi:hypothetical protein